MWMSVPMPVTTSVMSPLSESMAKVTFTGSSLPPGSCSENHS
jgi:hypothetical protein